ncbi:MAG: hypothetical protein HZA37_02130 [Parcubacteria group bacterium]|nr:hypothetical protein [Parcubacteria group bacterium]
MDTNNNTGNNQNQTSVLAKAKQLSAAIKKENDDLKRRTAELSVRADQDDKDLENLENNLKRTEIDAINKMDTAVFEFLSADEKEEEEKK